MKIVILGKGDMLSNLIEGIHSANYDIVGVLRYERIIYSPLKLKLIDFFKPSNALTLIKKYKIKDIKCNSANSKEFQNLLIKENVDVLLVGTWGEKINKKTIDIPTIASVNVHPSLLPKYRGPNPYLQNIWHQEKRSGITFHLLDETFDTGAIIAQKEIKIYPDDTAKDLKARTVFTAKEMVSSVLKGLYSGLIIPIEQDNKKATYFKNIHQEDIMLDFNKETAEEIYAHIKAFHPWLPCYVTVKNDFYIPNPYQLEIIEGKNKKPGNVIEKDPKKKSITVQCLENKAIKMNNVKIYGILKKPFTKLFIERLKLPKI